MTTPTPSGLPQPQTVARHPKEIIRETIGFDFEPGELQTVNADDLLRLAAALSAPAVETVAVQEAREPWALYLSDRADGVKGRYAIARWNPAGYREVWNLRRHAWGAFSDDVLTLEEAHALMKTAALAPLPVAPKAEPVAWLDPAYGLSWLVDRMKVAPGTKLYATPQAASAQPVVADTRQFEEWLDERRDLPVAEVFHDVVAKYGSALASPPRAIPAEQAAPVAWTNPEGLRKLQRGFGVTVSPTPQMHPEGEAALYLGPASHAAPVEAESAAETLLTEIRRALNASGVWHLGMDTIDIIKSLIASRQAEQAAPTEPKLPEGWVPLSIEWEAGYPEEVAYGPQVMMVRLQRWLERYYAMRLAAHPHEAADRSAEAKYQELLYAVASKHPGETRHQTALRYIRQAEEPTGEKQVAAMGTPAAAEPGKGEGK